MKCLVKLTSTGLHEASRSTGANSRTYSADATSLSPSVEPKMARPTKIAVITAAKDRRVPPMWRPAAQKMPARGFPPKYAARANRVHDAMNMYQMPTKNALHINQPKKSEYLRGSISSATSTAIEIIGTEPMKRQIVTSATILETTLLMNRISHSIRTSSTHSIQATSLFCLVLTY